MSVQRIKNSFWRVPLIALIAGCLYTPCFVRIVIRFYVKEPERMDDIAIWTSGLLLAAIFIVGWAVLLRKQTRMEVFISSSIVVVYGLLLSAIQSLFGNMTDSVAVVLLLLNTPLDWTVFPSSLGNYLQEHYALTIPFIGSLHFFIPWLFTLFGRKDPK